MGDPKGMPTVRTNISKNRHIRTLAAIIAATLALAGCGSGGIEFKGKIFDAIGVNSTGPKTKTNLPRRSGLVTPPSLKRLPPPGSEPARQDALASINDPDRVKVESAQKLAKRQAEYCAKHYEPARARGDDSADSIEGPGGPCRNSVFTALKKWSSQE